MSAVRADNLILHLIVITRISHASILYYYQCNDVIICQDVEGQVTLDIRNARWPQGEEPWLFGQEVELSFNYEASLQQRDVVQCTH